MDQKAKQSIKYPSNHKYKEYLEKIEPSFVKSSQFVWSNWHYSPVKLSLANISQILKPIYTQNKLKTIGNALNNVFLRDKFQSFLFTTDLKFPHVIQSYRHTTVIYTEILYLKFKLSNQNIVFLPRDEVISPGISLLK